ncbi:MAG TPA: hypothetical protein ENK55_08990 [Actinobacteria bacterium]|nr:hypothetical protein [Actinomycetota bacterium]
MREWAEQGAPTVGEILRIPPGGVAALVGPHGSGLTALGISLLAESSSGTVVVVDGRGWFSPETAWRAGIAPERLVVVRRLGAEEVPRVVAALVDGIGQVYVELPTRLDPTALRRLAARIRARRSRALFRSTSALPSGVATLTIEAVDVVWEGVGRGYGRLRRRRTTVRARGKAMGGTARTLELEDDGANGLRVVSGVAAAATGRAAG